MYPLTQGTASTGLRTIMAYPYEGHPGQGVRNFWSNPRMILPESGTPLGVEGLSDNAGVLTKNRFTYAATGDESGQCWSTGVNTLFGGGKHIICYYYQYVTFLSPHVKTLFDSVLNLRNPILRSAHRKLRGNAH